MEEARSLGKPVALSRIPVHVEQNPPHGHYFDPNDAGSLAAHLRSLWLLPASQDSHEREEEARRDLRARTLAFGRAYLQLVQDLAQREPASPRDVAALPRSS